MLILVAKEFVDLRWVDGDLNANEEFIRRYNTVQIDSATLVQVVQLKDQK